MTETQQLNVGSGPGESRPVSDLVDDRLPDGMVERFRRDGFLRIRGVFQGTELERHQQAVGAYLDAHRQESRIRDLPHARTFTQLVNVWRLDDAVARLSLSPLIGRLAAQLTGKPVRLWHDQMLVKEPHNAAATNFHQDRPLWPHTPESGPSLTAWMAMVDVPVERGCMTFMPGTHRVHGLRSASLAEPRALFEIDPDMEWRERVTLPLRAGDITFHHSYTAHYAGPNETDLPRIAHVAMIMDAETRFDGRHHVVTEGLGLEAGQVLDGEMFPIISA